MESSDDEESVDPQSQLNQAQSSVLALCLYLLSWQVSYKLPDSCVTALLIFLHHFLNIIASLVFCNALSEFAQSIPRSIKHLQRITGLSSNQFIQYVVCPKCHSIYDFHSCINNMGNRRESKHCQHIPFPNHPQLTRRSECSQALMKVVRKNNQISLNPFKVFCYRSVKQTLQDMLFRSNFIDMCEKWRARNIPNGTLAYIYDGHVWKQFVVVNSKQFLSTIFLTV